MGVRENLLSVYEQSSDWERQRGYEYYDWQRAVLFEMADRYGAPRDGTVAAFCVLSPNNSEKVTYMCLSTCLRITNKELPKEYKVSTFGRNKDKALRLLSGEPVEEVISGPKVTAFYYNTMNPDDDSWITIDGHMLNMCRNQRKPLIAVRKLWVKQYNLLAEEIRQAGRHIGIPAPRMQSILWLTWKRIHRILWKPQLTFGFMHPADSEIAGKGRLV